MGRSSHLERDRLRIAVATISGLIGAIVMAQLCIQTITGPPETGAAPAGQAAQQAYARLPLTFVENKGQTDGRVRYLTQGTRYGFFFTPEALVMSLLHEHDADGASGVNLSLDFVGAGSDVTVDGRLRTPGTVSYLRDDGGPAALPAYGEIVYSGLWPGVDMAVNGRDGVLKYEFRIAPGGSPDGIRLRYRGADGVAIDGEGGLVVDTVAGSLRDAAPVTYQMISGKRVPVRSRYALEGQTYGFAVGAYDPAHELVIDPGLEYASYLGGFGNQSGAAVAVDAAGNAYVTGFTQSPTFPTTTGAFDRTGSVSNDLDAFVSKINPSGTALVYSTFLGGSNFDWGRDIAVDAAGNAYVAGNTKSPNFPTTSGAFDRTFNVDSCPRCGIDQYDAYLAKLNPAGSGLVYSTFLGGFDFDDILAMTIDGSGQAYVAGQTASGNFPVTAGAFDTTANGGYDNFVAKFNAQGSQLLYSTRLGGADNELPAGIAVDAGGNAVVSGSTRSADFPSTAGTVQPVHGGGEFIDLFDGFVTKLNPGGTGLVFSTFLGGPKPDSAGKVFLDPAGNVYLGGGTSSPGFPTTPGVWDTVFDGDSESFVAKLNPAASAFVYSTFLDGAGGSLNALNADGSVWLAGSGGPASFVSLDAADGTFNGGNSDAYVARLNPSATGFGYGSFIGGTDSEGAADLAVDAAGDLYLAGTTRSADFPVGADAFDRTYGGDPFIFGADAWVAKIGFGAGTPTPTPAPTSTGDGPLPAPSLVSPAADARFSPGATVTFDWNDVAGAATYTLQIDNSSTFAAPYTLEVSVTASQHAAAGLPTQRMWWRVRAVDANGTPGSWTSGRRFEIKN